MDRKENSCRKNALHRKGTLYTLEAAIAIVMMTTALAFFLRSVPEPQDLSMVNYKLDIYNALELTEESGDLRKDALDEDADSIKTELETYLPSSLDFGVTIYNTTANITAVPDFSDTDGDILTVGYFLAGRVGNYTPREIRVFAWGMD